MLYTPRERLRPLEALSHPFFNELRDEQFGIPNIKLPNFFDFSKGTLFHLCFRGIIHIT